MFAWAVSREMIPPSVYQAMQTVPGLKKNRSSAREKPPVDAVPDEVIERTLEHLNPTVAAMVRFQRLSGCRPQEVCGIRADEIDRSDPSCWAYRPGRHKGQHHEQDRVIFIGPKGQAILAPFLALGGDGLLFSPKRAEADRAAAKRAGRVTPLYPSHQRRRRASMPKRWPGDRYTRHSYRVAIQRACDRAGVPKWHPHQIRHTAGTAIREAFGIEHSKAVLGHSEISSTLIYAAQDLARAREVARKVG
jgi:integrase